MPILIAWRTILHDRAGHTHLHEAFWGLQQLDFQLHVRLVMLRVVLSAKRYMQLVLNVWF